MGRYSYPHTIDNGSGERITFLRVVPGPKGDRLELDNVVTPQSGPPMHVHYFQDEAVTVHKGRVAYQRPGQPAQFAGPGDTMAFKAGDPHKFWNVGQDDLLGRGYIEPADNVEYFLTELYASTKRNGGRPSLFDAAFLIRRYRGEFGMLEIPAAVQQVVFPILVMVGRLLGKYRRYADAPEPVRR